MSPSKYSSGLNGSVNSARRWIRFACREEAVRRCDGHRGGASGRVANWRQSTVERCRRYSSSALLHRWIWVLSVAALRAVWRQVRHTPSGPRSRGTKADMARCVCKRARPPPSFHALDRYAGIPVCPYLDLFHFTAAFMTSLHERPYPPLHRRRSVLQPPSVVPSLEVLPVASAVPVKDGSPLMCCGAPCLRRSVQILNKIGSFVNVHPSTPVRKLNLNSLTTMAAYWMSTGCTTPGT